MIDPVNTGQKQCGRFQLGRSGNPAGRPKGARNRSTLAAEALLEGEAEALTRKAIDMALAGDPTALRLCMERLVPPRKDRPVSLQLPAITRSADVPAAIGAVLDAVATGEITPAEGATVLNLIDATRRTLEAAPAAPAPGGIRIVVSFTEAPGMVLESHPENAGGTGLKEIPKSTRQIGPDSFQGVDAAHL